MDENQTAPAMPVGRITELNRDIADQRPEWAVDEVEVPADIATGNAPIDKTDEFDMRDRTADFVDPATIHPGPTAEKPQRAGLKDTNPKDAVGTKKWRQYCTVPTTIIWELGVAMLEGARKYGRHNYRVAGVRGSVYVDAAKGHIDQWWEGEDIDEESGLSHLTKAMASLAVLRDAIIHDKFLDDRPPKTNLDKLRDDLQTAVEGIFERHPDAVDAYLEGDQYDDGSSDE